MNQYNLCVYGHLTVDRVFENFNETTSLGAIANFWYTTTKLNTNLRIKLNPISIGEAIIFVNKKNSERIGRGNLNIKTRIPPKVDAGWHHIMYMNRLPDLSFIDDLKGIVSADVTAGSMDNILPYLGKIDYLFISDEDLFMDVHDLAKLVKKSVILHYPSGSMCVDKTCAVYEGFTNVIQNIDVLGAGDIFAACVITKLIETNNIETSINFAHNKTKDILISRNKNEN